MKQFILQTDASEVGLGFLLSKEVMGKKYPILCMSRKLFPWEVNYSIIEKEVHAPLL